jgi:hypothetical protein
LAGKATSRVAVIESAGVFMPITPAVAGVASRLADTSRVARQTRVFIRVPLGFSTTGSAIGRAAHPIFRRRPQGSGLKPSARTVHLPSLGKPGVGPVEPSQPPAIIATAASSEPLDGK